MENRGWFMGVGLGSLFALATWACGDGSDDAPRGTGASSGRGGTTAGSGGTTAGGGGTTAGSGGTTAGSGGTTAGSGGTDTCAPRSLELACKDLGSPDSAADVELSCGQGKFTKQRSSSCGGVVITQDFYFGYIA